jgi:hypothetical protein
MKGISGKFGGLVVCALLTACGERSPEASAAAAQAETASTPTSQLVGGVRPRPVDGLHMPAANGAEAKCNIETIDSTSFEAARPAVRADRTLELVGWYAGSAGSDVRLMLANEAGSHWVVDLPQRSARPDVAASLGDDSALESGFAVSLDLSQLAPGEYGLYLADAANNSASACGVGRGITLQPM